jgi:SAM-dependent methyltransferase
MAEAASTIQADFDCIALLSSEGWDHNSHYHDFLLAHVPPSCGEALDVGCGTGAFARLLARRADRVFALDLSPQMIHLAGERSEQYPNIDFCVADVATWVFPPGQFDCVASIATLHHLPLAEMLAKMRDALRVGGVLLVLDLYRGQGLSDVLVSAVAAPVSLVLRLLRNRRLRDPREVRAAWAAHGQHDTCLPLSQIRRICATVLPGAEMRRHLLWRYSIAWKKR